MYLGTNITHRVARVENIRGVVVLDDGSKWEVQMMDKSKSMTWLISDQVTVESYMAQQHRLTNQNRNSSVLCEACGLNDHQH
jgi:hypothetical protein